MHTVCNPVMKLWAEIWTSPVHILTKGGLATTARSTTANRLVELFCVVSV